MMCQTVLTLCRPEVHVGYLLLVCVVGKAIISCWIFLGGTFQEAVSSMPQPLLCRSCLHSHFDAVDLPGFARLRRWQKFCRAGRAGRHPRRSTSASTVEQRGTCTCLNRPARAPAPPPPYHHRARHKPSPQLPLQQVRLCSGDPGGSPLIGACTLFAGSISACCLLEVQPASDELLTHLLSDVT